MKSSPIVLALLLACFALQAQSINKPFSATGTIVLIMDNTDLTVEGYAGSDVQIEASGYDGPPERAKGLRALSSRGQDNTGMGLEITSSGGTMEIKKTTGQSVDYRIKVPQRANIKIEEDGWGGSGDYEVRSCQGEIEIVTTNSDMKLENVSGPIIAKSTSGDITVKYGSLNTEKPTSIVATSGFIDVSFSASAKASLKLKTITGDIYSDLDLAIPNSEFKQTYSSNISGDLNGGGVEISLHAISGDIYLRKQ